MRGAPLSEGGYTSPKFLHYHAMCNFIHAFLLLTWLYAGIGGAIVVRCFCGSKENTMNYARMPGDIRITTALMCYQSRTAELLTREKAEVLAAVRAAGSHRS